MHKEAHAVHNLSQCWADQVETHCHSWSENGVPHSILWFIKPHFSYCSSQQILGVSPPFPLPRPYPLFIVEKIPLDPIKSPSNPHRISIPLNPPVSPIGLRDWTAAKRHHCCAGNRAMRRPGPCSSPHLDARPQLGPARRRKAMKRWSFTGESDGGNIWNMMLSWVTYGGYDGDM